MNNAPESLPLAPEASSEARVFYIRLDRRQGIEQHLVAINKRAAKKGLSGSFSWRWGRAYVQVIPCDCETCVHVPRFHDPRRVDRIVLVVEGESPKYQGWSFLAALDHLSGDAGEAVNVIRAVPGAAKLPTEYRTRGPVCDHCKTKRRRGATYVVQHDDGRTVQVGSTCIADFLGRDALRAAALAELLASIASACDDEDEGGSWGSARETEFRLDDVLGYVAMAIRHAGWIPRSRTREEGGLATADLAMIIREIKRTGRYQRGEEDLRALNLEEGDVARVERAVAWAEAIPEDTDSDYLHNLRAIARCNLVTHKTLGLAASIIAACEREDAKRAAKDRPAAPAYFGKVKERARFVLTCVGYSAFDTLYGTTHLFRFQDSNGSVAVWKASSQQEIRQGGTYTIVGTVKEHGEYKGRPQTVLTRCDVLGEGDVPMPEKVRAPKPAKRADGLSEAQAAAVEKAREYRQLGYPLTYNHGVVSKSTIDALVKKGIAYVSEPQHGFSQSWGLVEWTKES